MIDPVLVYSTYLGGTKDDLGEALAIDSSGDAYITGYTLSTDFPTSSGALETGCKPSTTAACSQDAFVAKIKADGAALVYSTTWAVRAPIQDTPLPSMGPATLTWRARRIRPTSLRPLRIRAIAAVMSQPRHPFALLTPS